TIKAQGLVGFKEMIVRTDLNRTIAGICNVERERLEPEVGVERGRFGRGDDFAGYHGQRMGLWTVTSFVPSGNVASTCTSWIISGTPSITSLRLRTVVPKLM